MAKKFVSVNVKVYLAACEQILHTLLQKNIYFLILISELIESSSSTYTLAPSFFCEQVSSCVVGYEWPLKIDKSIYYVRPIESRSSHFASNPKPSQIETA